MRVIDLFSGPGGLGEGFASLNGGKSFSIEVSAEMDTSAHSTLTLRAFFRHAQKAGDKAALNAYYDFCRSGDAKHPRDACPTLWSVATDEARQLTLGEPTSNSTLDEIIVRKKLGGDDTILIGGPPCQAYSLVGRARNAGKAGYVPEDDHRHYLYRQYLRVLGATTPAVFVMENVKGILSSKVGGRQIFHDILMDLRDPAKALTGKAGAQYVIRSLSAPTFFSEGMNVEDIDARDFVIQAERYGIPQTRHRVILVGIRSDIPSGTITLAEQPIVVVRDAISDLPDLRSGLRAGDSDAAWSETITKLCMELKKSARAADMGPLARYLKDMMPHINGNLSRGSLRERPIALANAQDKFAKWVCDPKLRVVLNHEARPHMTGDLRRYLYASAFAALNDRSPRGHTEFNLPSLAPDHANWSSGQFVDRFKVQRYDAPSSTVTSHISKDGHYFIHPDPTQCRALTVREAARLQTFPDNYFFQGGRTQQYHQVGNAVPPLLAHSIASVVKRVTSA